MMTSAAAWCLFLCPIPRTPLHALLGCIKAYSGQAGLDVPDAATEARPPDVFIRPGARGGLVGSPAETMECLPEWHNDGFLAAGGQEGVELPPAQADALVVGHRVEVELLGVGEGVVDD
jgi:hypothetical protein